MKQTDRLPDEIPVGLPVLAVPRRMAIFASGLKPRQFSKAIKDGHISPPLPGTDTFLVEQLRRDLARWGGLDDGEGDWGL